MQGWGRREHELEYVEEHLEDYILLKIVDAIVAVAVTMIVLKLFEPFLKQGDMLAHAAIQAVIKRV